MSSWLKGRAETFRPRPLRCLPHGVLEPELFPQLSRTSFLASLNAVLSRCVQGMFGSLPTFREDGGQETVHLFVLDQSELPKHRRTDESSSHFLDRQELVDDFQHSRVVAFVRINRGIRIAVRRFVVFPNSILLYHVLLG